MNLAYRGIAYQPSSSVVEVAETEQTVRFLGKSYKLQQGKVAQRQNSTQLTYRGVAYNP